MRSRPAVLACLLPLFLFADACGQRATDFTRIDPDFTRIDATGHRVRLSEYKGKVVLLDFWATWCTGCKQEVPWYVDFVAKYSQSGLVAIGVAMDHEGWKVVKPFLAEKIRITYPVVIGDEALSRQFGRIQNLPLTLLIDRQGRIAYSHAGIVDRDKFEGRIRELLARAR